VQTDLLSGIGQINDRNTDLADGWEREGENKYYHREFSLKKEYPV
jgi:hypothetical protein